MSEDKTELFVTPDDTRARALALDARFTQLWRQAGGGTKLRLPRKLQTELDATRKRYRKFFRRLSFGLGGALEPRKAGSDYAVLQLWYKTYAKLARKVETALGKPLWKAARPKKLPKKGTVPVLAALSSGAYTLLAAAAVGWFVSVWSSRRS